MLWPRVRIFREALGDKILDEWARTLQCLSEFEQIHLSLTLKGVTKLSLTKFEKLEMRPHLIFFSRSAHIKYQDTEIVLFS